MQRRTLLRLLGVTTVGGTAGCLSSSEEPGASPDETPAVNSSSETMSDTDSATTEDDTDERNHDETADGECPDGLVTHTCQASVAEAVDAITAQIEESPLTLMTTVDHAENAASVDEELPPTTLLLFGNPEVGTPLMQASRTAAIDLPQKMLLWEDGDALKITYNDPQYLARRHGIEEQEERLEQVSTVLEDLATGWT